MQDDITQLDKRIRGDQIDADKARQSAKAERERADGYRRAGDTGKAEAHEQSAARYEHKAREYDEDRDAATDHRQRITQKIDELTDQRAKLVTAHEQELKLIDKEIQHLNGSSMTLL